MKQLWSEQQSEQDLMRNRELISMGKMPRHCAIIMDGNGRWAQERSKPRVAGHEEGIESVRDIVKVSSQLDIKYLTLYAFSMEKLEKTAAGGECSDGAIRTLSSSRNPRTS